MVWSGSLRYLSRVLRTVETPRIARYLVRLRLAENIGRSTLKGVAYVGALAQLGSQSAYFTFIGPLKGKPVRLLRAIHQAMAVGVSAIPIVSLITFFVGVIIALQGA